MALHLNGSFCDGTVSKWCSVQTSTSPPIVSRDLNAPPTFDYLIQIHTKKMK